MRIFSSTLPPPWPRSIPRQAYQGDTVFAGTGTDEVFSCRLPPDGWRGLYRACKPSLS